MPQEAPELARHEAVLLEQIVDHLLKLARAAVGVRHDLADEERPLR
jgi:hypothetical protein